MDDGRGNIWGCAECQSELAAAKQRLSEKSTDFRPEILSESPQLFHYSGVLDSVECMRIKRILLAALIYFNDTAADGSMRQGSGRYGFGSEWRPRYLVAGSQQVSLHFEDPPEVIKKLYARMAEITSVPAEHVEAVFHIYSPGAMPTNLHLDNFNTFVFPRRLFSSTFYFDDLEDGGTVFPLLNLVNLTGHVPASEVALNTAEHNAWQNRLKTSVVAHRSNLDTHSTYGLRRVEVGTGNSPFQLKAFEAALAMCQGGRSAQEPLVARQGSAYVWRNLMDDGTDDVRVSHAGCGARDTFKVIATIWVREGPGPFWEYRSFWDPLIPKIDPKAELKRVSEALMLQGFRLMYLKMFYDLLLELTYRVDGNVPLNLEYAQQVLHLRSLQTENIWERMRERIGGVVATWVDMGFPE